MYYLPLCFFSNFALKLCNFVTCNFSIIIHYISALYFRYKIMIQKIGEKTVCNQANLSRYKMQGYKHHFFVTGFVTKFVTQFVTY